MKKRMFAVIILICFLAALPVTAGETSFVKFEKELREAHQLVRDHQYSEAAKMFEQIAQEDSNQMDALLQLGLLYSILGDHEKAVERTQKAAELGPGYLPYYNLGLIYAADNSLKPALESFNKALEFSPNSYSAYYQKGLVYTSLKDYKLAAESYQKAVELNPQFDEAQLALGALTYERGDKAGALKRVEELKKMRKETVAKALENWIQQKETTEVSSFNG